MFLSDFGFWVELYKVIFIKFWCGKYKESPKKPFKALQEIRQSINGVRLRVLTAYLELWNFWGVNYHQYLSCCHFLSNKPCLSAASAATKKNFDSILEVPAARVVLFSEGLQCSIESTITIHLQRKQWPTEHQQPHIVTAPSAPPLWDTPSLSCRRVGALSLRSKRDSCQQEAQVRQRILNRKANET